MTSCRHDVTVRVLGTNSCYWKGGGGHFAHCSVQVLLIRSFQELGLAVLMCTVMRTCLPRTRNDLVRINCVRVIDEESNFGRACAFVSVSTIVVPHGLSMPLFV
jgi:hypothetical protein